MTPFEAVRSDFVRIGLAASTDFAAVEPGGTFYLSGTGGLISANNYSTSAITGDDSGIHADSFGRSSTIEAPQTTNPTGGDDFT
ncbi:MAG: hypothetical protein GY927_04185, partial [bacterium]|nr:hypothetical protein [bacterium]